MVIPFVVAVLIIIGSMILFDIVEDKINRRK